MKLFAFLLLFSCGLFNQVKAQNNISSASTEETINFLAELLKKQKLKDLIFNGTELQFTDMGILKTFKYIDWSTYEGMDCKTEKVFGGMIERTSCSYSFTAPLLRLYHMSRNQGFDLFEVRGINLGNDLMADAIKEFDKAALRLRDLAKNKKNTLLQVTIPEEGIKPILNRRETQEQLNTMLKNNIGLSASGNQLKVKYGYRGLFELVEIKNRGGKEVIVSNQQLEELDCLDFILQEDIIFRGKTKITNEKGEVVMANEMTLPLKENLSDTQRKKLVQTILLWLELYGFEDRICDLED